ncbi:MAG: sulfur transferase domain-containing protein [Zavarzinia sp.]|nr:sulfur transferase domain-containing protein [Zavarzinia sp.]
MESLKKLTPFLSVTPQINAGDVGTLSALGFRSIINSRPDGEAPDQPPSAEIEAAARRLGLAYRHVPAISGNVSDEAVADYAAALAELKARTGDVPGAIGTFEEAAGKPEAALQANKRLGDLYAGIASDQLALGYYAKAIEQPVRRPEDEALRAAARTARDAQIRRMAPPK